MKDILFAILPILVMVIGAVVLMIEDMFSEDFSYRGALVLATSLTSIGASIAIWTTTGHTHPTLVTDWFAIDNWALLNDIIVGIATAIAGLLSAGYLIEHRLARVEFEVMMLLSAAGAMVLGHSTDLLSLFLGLEILSFGVYGMVAFRRHSPKSAEGALKYFLLGGFASAILLFGFALLYGATGSTALAEIAAKIPESDSRILLLSVIFILAGFAFKVSAVPFHMWTPDAYEGAITPATAFMSVVVKASVFASLVRVFSIAFSYPALASPDSGWPPAWAALAAMTLVVGNLAAIGQKNIKRLLAYSSIAHGGFLIIGMLGAWKMQDASMLGSIMYYLFAYTFSNLLAFGGLVLLGSWKKEAVTLTDIQGAGRRHPLIGAAFVIGMLSLMGFPPTAGFFAKYLVLSNAVAAGSIQGGHGLIWLSVLAVITSLISAYYYLRVLVSLYMKEHEQEDLKAVPMNNAYVSFALAVSAFFVLQMGLMPSRYLKYSDAAAHSLTGPKEPTDEEHSDSEPEGIRKEDAPHDTHQ